MFRPIMYWNNHGIPYQLYDFAYFSLPFLFVFVYKCRRWFYPDPQFIQIYLLHNFRELLGQLRVKEKNISFKKVFIKLKNGDPPKDKYWPWTINYF